MSLKTNQPIGVFDSGVGGLTVASAIKRLLPNEDMIYFGDTFHLPYGDKSKESVQFYSQGIAEFLLKNECKAIVIACNTASANAFQSVKEFVGDRAIVIDVISPVVDFIVNATEIKNLGVIGTKGTVNSGTYQNRINELRNDVKVVSLATPLLVPMIEEGFIFDDISNAIIRSYLSRYELKSIDSLILGCTHYPIIKNQISKYFNFGVQVIDGGQLVASRLREVLADQNLLNNSRNPQQTFYVSDYTDYFKIIAKMFFEKEVPLIKIDFWK